MQKPLTWDEFESILNFSRVGWVGWIFRRGEWLQGVPHKYGGVGQDMHNPRDMSNFKVGSNLKKNRPSQDYEDALITQNNCPAIRAAVAGHNQLFLMATTFDPGGPYMLWHLSLPRGQKGIDTVRLKKTIYTVFFKNVTLYSG